MQKVFATILAAAVLQFASPVIPAQAAPLDQRVTDFIMQNPNLLQQVIELKQDLDQGNRNVALNKIVANVIANNNNQVVNAVASSGILPAIANGDIMSAIEDSNLTEAIQTQLREGVGTMVREEVEKRVGDKLPVYQTQAAAIAQLLNKQPAVNSNAAAETNSTIAAPANYKQVIDMTATAYAPGYEDNGKWGDLTYMGGTVKKGIAAVDPKVIPMGTRLWIEGYGEAIAEDQGSAIKGNRIDLAFDTRPEAVQYGMQKVKVYVME